MSDSPDRGAGTLPVPRTLRLLDLEATPEVSVEFPDGSTAPLAYYDAAGYQLYAEVRRTGDDADALRLLTLAVPTATEEQLSLLTAGMAWRLIQTAARKADAATAVLEKNGRAGPPPPDAPGPTPPTSRRPRSGRRTPSSTPSPASPAPSGATGGPS